MTRIDFYLLPAGAPEAALNVACRLCDKAVHAGQRVYAFSPDAAALAELDAQLWTFRQGSFIGHERYTEGVASDVLPAVYLGTSAPPASHAQVMINLGAETPHFFSQFERVLEIVPGDAPGRAAARKRFRFYKDRGYALATHELGNQSTDHDD
ncbi:MAG: DNA polymerase III subunit chi [Nevskiaceae bacterium]|nr:MAG: DNA polymerase III subunit chi [Nevskiaceae bacterium]TBR74113.1 MAG: DNA polymerase III subunit chi [Nevskiaceae bacterium]